MDKESLRRQALEDSDKFAEKSRFGLFSHPISTAVGDNGPYQSTLHPREDQGKGKPLLQPRNFQSGKYRTGQLDNSLFEKTRLLAGSPVKDEYIEIPKRLLREENERYSKRPNKEANFKPNSGNKLLSKAAYKYIDENPTPLDPKRNRTESGVKTKMPNVTSNPPNKIASMHFKPSIHYDDPFDRAHKQALEKQIKDKTMEPDSAFKPASLVGKVFDSDKKVYEDIQLKKKNKPVRQINIASHDGAWKPSRGEKHGMYGCFSPFPAYHENPPKQITRQRDSEKKQAFKPGNSPVYTRPTPSISLNHISLHKHTLPSVHLRA